ncbi:tryptophan 7-halogenase [Asticcacaulis sp. EMRT-3]|uniref:tryptophan halogenase family protein n=1 Tax=Asticcacaulis sp. EMRT-3 TaxID=3040349 RepID=UPI0024AF908A|nr:tryptophan 7-halogenase [Asticcacaulis sp. EMRT-3]MDI7776083.1 tryptophan 7-halogenase [Asticcacaulis sp. EMRT-3]
MSPDMPVKKLVIAGCDAAAWLSACALMRAFGPSGLNIEVVELPSLLRPQDVVASLPPLEAFHRLLGIDEHTLLKATGGAYSLGQGFANFSGTAAPFFHPYGDHGIGFENISFAQLWFQARRGGLPVSFEDFSLTAVAAKNGRFFIGDSQTQAFGRNDYAYHMVASAYVRFLKNHALGMGVSATTARGFDVVLEEDGAIKALHLADGRMVAGDLFIDATGADSLLLGQALGVGFESWSSWLPFNRILSAGGEGLRSLPPCSQVRALEAGCLHMTAVQGMTGVMHAYDGQWLSDEQAAEALNVTAGLPIRSSLTLSERHPGQRSVAWARNCIAIGEAACVFDPIDNPDLHALQLGLAHLITLFPLSTDCAVEAAEYNRIIRNGHERIRDYQITHYRLNRLHDRPFWDGLRDMDVPDTLREKLALFEARGLVALGEDETFTSDDWLSIFIGHGLMPKTYDPVVDLVSQDAAIRHVQGLLGFIRERVQDMDSHDAYLELFVAHNFA